MGGGGFVGEVKARPKDIISSSLGYQKQKLSTDKQSIIKPHSTRHAGKAGGFTYIYIYTYIALYGSYIYSYMMYTYTHVCSSTPCTKRRQRGFVW